MYGDERIQVSLRLTGAPSPTGLLVSGPPAAAQSPLVYLLPSHSGRPCGCNPSQPGSPRALEKGSARWFAEPVERQASNEPVTARGSAFPCYPGPRSECCPTSPVVQGCCALRGGQAPPGHSHLSRRGAHSFLNEGPDEGSWEGQSGSQQLPAATAFRLALEEPSGAPALPSTWQEAHSIFQTPFSPSASPEPGWRGDVYFLLPAGPGPAQLSAFKWMQRQPSASGARETRLLDTCKNHDGFYPPAFHAGEDATHLFGLRCVHRSMNIITREEIESS